MNLRHVFYRIDKAPAPVSTEAAPLNPSIAEVSKGKAGNVIAIPQRTPMDAPAGLNAPLTDGAVEQGDAPTSRLRGLMDSPEIKAFFADDYFAKGRHNGACYRTQDALDQDKHTIITAFQNTLSEQIERKQAKANKLHDTLLDTHGLCTTTTARIELARTHIDRDIEMLQVQISNAAESKGWVLDALNRYQTGFGRGMREAVAFDLLND
jgi:hypothetical protein